MDEQDSDASLPDILMDEHDSDTAPVEDLPLVLGLSLLNRLLYYRMSLWTSRTAMLY